MALKAVLAGVSAIASIAQGGMSFLRSREIAKAQEAAARREAAEREIAAKRERAAGDVKVEEEERKRRQAEAIIGTRIAASGASVGLSQDYRSLTRRANQRNAFAKAIENENADAAARNNRVARDEAEYQGKVNASNTRAAGVDALVGGVSSGVRSWVGYYGGGDAPGAPGLLDIASTGSGQSLSWSKFG